LGRHVRRSGGAERPERAPAILNFADYTASGFDSNSTAAKNIVATGYPPDLVSGTSSLWGLYSAQFWEVTLCQWQKRLDPSYDTYGSGTDAATRGEIAAGVKRSRSGGPPAT